MKIWIKLCSAFSIIVILTILFGYLMISQLNMIIVPFQKEIPNTLDNIQKTAILDQYAQLMKYYDEVLTQSARNYAFTQDKKWEETYRIADSALELIIQDAIKKGDANDSMFFSNVDDANTALLKMEYESLELINQGHPDKAIKILESKEYWDQKKAYQLGLTDYIIRHNTNSISAIETHANELNNIHMAIMGLIKNEINIIFVAITSIVIVLIIIGFVIIRSISKSISNLRVATNQIAQGNFTTRINVTGNDEISDFANDINIMAIKLCEYNTNLIKNERLYAIGEVAARLGHDLRNPLSNIKNALEIIQLQTKNGIYNEKIQEKYDLITRSISRMSYQIEDVLDFVRTRPLDFSVHSISNIIRQSSKNVSKSDNVKINLPQNDLKISCDAGKLEIVFINLITNALQAIKNTGEITIRITDDKDSVLITIEDSGSGIPEEALKKIFEPLFTTKQTGTGLGLTSCKTIIEQHGGKITARNNPTTFTVRIPKICNI